MSITTEESELLEKGRTGLSQNEHDLVDDMMGNLRSLGLTYDVKIAGDDRAARVEAALIRFIIQSRA